MLFLRGYYIILVLIALFAIGAARSSIQQSADTYRAAVVEFNPVRARNPYEVLPKKAAQEIMLTNLASYEVVLTKLFSNNRTNYE
jgi:hypothetical protein